MKYLISNTNQEQVNCGQVWRQSSGHKQASCQERSVD